MATSLGLFGVLAAACGASGNGQGADGGDEIVIGAVGAMSGNASSIRSFMAGVDARYQQQNANGGIDGHKIRFVTRDDQYDPSVTPGKTRELVEQEDVDMLCSSPGSTTYAAVKNYVEAKGVPSVPGGGGPELLGKWTFEVLPSYTDMGILVANYAIKDLGVKKLAVAYSPDDLGRPFLDGVEKQAKSMGVDLIKKVKFDPNATSFASQAAQLKGSGADFVAINGIGETTAKMVNAADQVGFYPAWGFTYASLVPELLDLTKGLLDKGNAYFADPFPLPDAPEASAFREAMKKYESGIDTSGVFPIEAYASADACVQALKSAVAKAGGVPSNTQILNAMQSMGEINNAYLHDLHWTEQNHQGVQEAQVVTVKDGKFKVVRPFKAIP